MFCCRTIERGLDLLHWLEIFSDSEDATGGLNEFFDGNIVSLLNQGQTLLVVDLEDSLLSDYHVNAVLSSQGQ